MDLSDASTTLLVVLALVIIAMLAALIVVGIRLLRTVRYLRDPEMPTGATIAFAAAVLYALSPVDLLPDPMLLDDIGVVVAATSYILRQARELGLVDGGSSGPGPGGRGGRTGSGEPVIDVREIPRP